MKQQRKKIKKEMESELSDKETQKCPDYKISRKAEEE
jgi:hypothetical protein